MIRCSTFLSSIKGMTMEMEIMATTVKERSPFNTTMASGTTVEMKAETMMAMNTRLGTNKATGTMVIDPTSIPGSMMTKIKIYYEVPARMVSLLGEICDIDPMLI
jgi:hypothetical protein